MISAMFRRVVHRPVVCGRSKSVRNSRSFSLLSVHTSFPATLYRFQLKRESQLYDMKLQQEENEADDAVNIAQDGLIYPGVSDSGESDLPFLLFAFGSHHYRQFQMEHSSCQTPILCRN